MKKLWQPTQESIRQSNIKNYIDYLGDRYHKNFTNYDELWTWSIDHSSDFWSSLFEYFQIEFDGKLDVVSEGAMPQTMWFPNVELNYAEHILKKASDAHPAILWKTEKDELRELSWSDLRQRICAVQNYLLDNGLQPGDRVAAFMPNIPETSVAFVATVSLGGVWSSCSPDFGAESVIDRFEQIEPKILLATDGYYYNGKSFDKRPVVEKIFARLTKTDCLLQIPFLGLSLIDGATDWNALTALNQEVIVKRLPFGHPIWILYSSGTTGAPKAITHSHGGILLEHLKYISFHNDVRSGERFFWYSTTGWMMWNFVHASWLVGATVVLYDGSAAYPSIEALWKFIQNAKIQHFGTSAPFIIASMKCDLTPGDSYDLSTLRSIGSTGSPLPPEGFDWIYNRVKEDLWLCSISGGTDLCTAFVGGCPVKAVYSGQIQCRTLGCALYSWDEDGQHQNNRVGEMVIMKPMPSMPIYFWNDENYERYTASYFEMFPGVWRHGDWVELLDNGGLVIYGRSDATLNRQGIRIGTSEIYRALDDIHQIKDSVIVNLELEGGKHYMPLFVLLNPGVSLSDELINEIKMTLRRTYSPRHVPDEIIQVDDIPYTISGKKMEAPVKKILLGMSTTKSINKGAMRNPKSTEFFESFAKTIKYK